MHQACIYTCVLYLSAFSKITLVTVVFPFHINGDMSARMMAILGEMALGQEIYSIDESFLNVSGISSYMPLEDFCLQMRSRVKKEIGLTIGVGFGPSKTLAKLANFAAKKLTQTGGIVNLTSPERQRKLLALVSVDDIWGIGGRLSKRLHTMGISTALQLAHSNISMIRKSFDVIVECTVRELNGESCLALEDAPPPKQQIVVSRSFGQRVTSIEDLQQAVVTYATRASEKLREQRSKCQHVSVSVNTGRYGNEPQYANSAAMTCEYPTVTHGTLSVWHCGLSTQYGATVTGTRKRVLPCGISTSQVLHSWTCSVSSCRVQTRML